jgi:hypothetical protein
MIREKGKGSCREKKSLVVSKSSKQATDVWTPLAVSSKWVKKQKLKA